VRAANGAAENEEAAMKFMVSLITDGTLMDEMTPEQRQEAGAEMMGFMSEIRQAGVLLDTDALAPSDTAKTLRHRGNGSKPLVTDGPFAETKEQIAGYMVLECTDLDEAVGWAQKLPVKGGAVEVRPIAERPEGA
jgi:hypothetical protein